MGLTVLLSRASALLFFLTAATIQAQPIAPGSYQIDPKRIRYGTVEYNLTVVRGDEEEAIGVVRDEIMPINEADPIIRRVQILVRSGSMVIDSSWSNAQTLAPVWHKSVQPGRTIEYEVEGLRLRGVVAPNDTNATVLDTVLSNPVFSASNWDLAVRSLPLAEGEAAIMSMYDVDRKSQLYSVQVIERSVRGKTDVIHVIVELGGGRTAHVWFDDATRVLLRVETQLGPDTVIRQVLRAHQF